MDYFRLVDLCARRDLINQLLPLWTGDKTDLFKVLEDTIKQIDLIAEYHKEEK